MACVHALRLPAFFAALVLGIAALAGCGGDSGGGAADESAASFAPASVTALISLNSDFDSEQWNTAEELLDKFPARDDLVDELRSAFTEEGIDFETEVKPAIGERVDVVLPAGGGLDGDFVLVTKAKDQAKMDTLLEQGDDPPAHEVIDGWTVIADEQATIDSFQREVEGEKLEDTEAWKEAGVESPDGALATVFVNGREATDELRQQLNRAGAAGAFPDAQLEWARVTAEAVSNGIRVEGTAKSSGGSGSIENFAPKLLEDVPAGVLALLSFNGQQGAAQLKEQLEGTPGLQNDLGEIERFLGTTLDELTELFAGEGVLYVRAGAPLPEVTLVLEQADPAAAVATLDRLARSAGGFLDARPEESTIDGVSVKTLTLGPVKVSYAGFDGKLVLTSLAAAISNRSGVDKLADDAEFQAASEAAGLPDESAGFLYLRLGELAELATGYAELAFGESGIPPEVDANLRPLQSLLAFSSQDGDESHFTGFLELE